MNINNIRYADGTVLVADTKEKLQELVVALHGACVARGREINVGPGKTEVMGLTKPGFKGEHSAGRKTNTAGEEI